MGKYPYLGNQELWYQQYRDVDTGRMLVAEPDGAYDMQPVEMGLPVPPDDNRWGTEVTTPPVVPLPSPPIVITPPAPAPVPAPAPEGGETQ